MGLNWTISESLNSVPSSLFKVQFLDTFLAVGFIDGKVICSFLKLLFGWWYLCFGTSVAQGVDNRITETCVSRLPIQIQTS